MSVPLVWTMINLHTTAFSGSALLSAFWLLLAVAAAWATVNWLYKKAGTVPGF
jgi:hypothetical protein